MSKRLESLTSGLAGLILVVSSVSSRDIWKMLCCSLTPPKSVAIAFSM
ncbi:hypothetical protein FOYG_04858 [Fusarium oxysporum NRRL 32931]|uniref:Uncharacterized protein n=1 Tax=Fusarium oxysporum NRRL 32931 TaxID=660029 RepID=W9ITF1_FUSOX|nr:hypothetical protein FOYG_04858 [Fusarium oxysporum NRRL 32931]